MISLSRSAFSPTTALNDLSNDGSITITKPDKGNGVVIVNKLDYLNKIKKLIETKLKKKTYTKPYEV